MGVHRYETRESIEEGVSHPDGGDVLIHAFVVPYLTGNLTT